MNNADKHLAPEMVNEDEGIYTQGDDVLYSFYCGNFSQGIKEMLEYNITPRELGEYLETLAEDCGCEISTLYNGHFTLSYFGEIGEAYDRERSQS